MNENNFGNTSDIRKKAWTITGIVAIYVILIWLFIALFNVLLLILAGILIALYFHGLSRIIHKTGIGKKASLVIAVIATALVILAFFYFAGNMLINQVNELQDTIPSVIKKFESYLSESSMGQKLLQRLRSVDSGKFTAIAQSFFRSTFGVLGDVYVVLFMGLFFTTSPGMYVNGFIRLIPDKKRQQSKTIIQKLGVVISKWLKGKIFAMLIVALLTLTGLLIMGIPMAFVLSVIAGTLNFIPNFGPIIAMIPAILVGLLQGPSTALIIIVLYTAVQIIESNIITPQIQKRLISMPPALIIIAQITMGILSGGWGVILATPLTAILIVIMKETFLKK